MDRFINPAAKVLANEVEHLGQRNFVQVQLRWLNPGFELRHIDDTTAVATGLRATKVEALRDLARTTADGAFRPLKSAPNLVRGWRTECLTVSEVEQALDALYPGALADWFAAPERLVSVGLPMTDPPADVTAAPAALGPCGVPGRGTATSFRDFVQRQTGMYRSAQKLNETQAAWVARGGCHSRFCLRQRRWSSGATDAGDVKDKSDLPCWEPCAIILELARRAARMDQDEKVTWISTQGEMESVRAALERMLSHPDPDIREGDSSAPTNPRRLQMLLEKLKDIQASFQETPKTQPH